MNWQLIELQIKKAQEEGAFDNLHGEGKPLPPDEFAHLPENLRMVMRIMKNAGYDDEALFIQQELADLKVSISKANSQEKTDLERVYNERMAKMNQLMSKKGVQTNSSMFKNYQEKIEKKFY
ncbi:DUF1992 domain-containing protein [Paenisporosarcina cavernae]|uniref:DUF1992 domain-containing protein n=1 Tax=Paenisporosarcina cavernae TaxID=2320858 RepID=A0A385YU07_9BACL|nr:DUF1992 domain-containing protein [Paenisporosarcina cavernae]AYC29790.1 DUF1992 domain-containing protein [Paenisporosarcina cavernae]